MGEKRNSYRFLVGKPKRKRSLTRRREGAGQIGRSYRNNTEVRGMDKSDLGERQMSGSCTSTTGMRNFLTEDHSASLSRFWFTELAHFRLRHRNKSKLHMELNIFFSDTRSNS